MKKSNNYGFSIVELILVIVVLAGITAAGVFAYSNFKAKEDSRSDKSQSKNTSQSSEADISLQNLGLPNFDTMIINSSAVREYSTQGLKGFYVFGDTLSGNRQNPNLEYASMSSDTKVVSAIDGVVGFIRQQEGGKDSEVFIQPKDGSAWQIGYDHLVNLSVEKGAEVKAGDVIGTPAVQNNGLHRFEFQINKDEDGVTTHYCPTQLLDSAIKDKWVSSLGDMQTKWETVTGLNLYDLDKQNPIGCLKPTLTPNEAEGR